MKTITVTPMGESRHTSDYLQQLSTLDTMREKIATGQPNPGLQITKRLNPQELKRIRREGPVYEACRKLRFFMQYPDIVAAQLLKIAQLKLEVPPGTKLFEQGQQLDGYYVIVRGTVKIEQKHERYKDRPDMPPIVIRTCYDGDQFAEMNFFKSRIGPENNLKLKKNETEEEFMKQHMKKQRSTDSSKVQLFSKERFMTDEKAQDLPPEEVRELNKQRTSAETMETCDLLYINKEQSKKIV